MVRYSMPNNFKRQKIFISELNEQKHYILYVTDHLTTKNFSVSLCFPTQDSCQNVLGLSQGARLNKKIKTAF